MPESASYVELLWSFLALVGFLVTAWLYRDARRGRQFWEAESTDVMDDIMTRGHMRSAFMRMFVQAVFLLVGIRAMTIQSTSTTTDDPMIISWLVPVGLIAAEVLIVGDALLARRDRIRLLELAQHREFRQSYMETETQP